MSDQVSDRNFRELLRMIRETRGFDFTTYKRSTLLRRISRRMDAVGIATFAGYRDYLELEHEEFQRLFDSLLINVTSFFRDAHAWQTLREQALPGILAAKGNDRPIRVWSAGCASGEEAYTLAILLTEVLGVDAFRRRVKIYATDLDEPALQHARTATYDERALSAVPEELRAVYFEQVGDDQYVFRRDLRRSVIFGRNDLTKDAPISRVDLLVTRNTLMYFNVDTQESILRRFHFALNDPGYLFLGKAEMLLSHDDRFEPLDLRVRLFRKVPALAGRRVEPRAPGPAGADERRAPTSQVAEAVFASGPVAQLGVDLAGYLAVANRQAESLFGLHPRDVGRPFQDLEVSYRPVELRSRIEQVRADLHPVELREVEWQRSPGASTVMLDVTVVPVYDAAGDLLGVGINFGDVTRYQELRAELESANQELEQAYGEVESLNEELETTNEELQSTNEELETSNEELQSTNEELETMNEELQSANNELQETNETLRVRSGEFDRANTFLESVLRSLGAAVVIVDDDLVIKLWNPGAEGLWGLKPTEAEGRHLLSLEIGLPVEKLAPLLRGLLADGEQATISTVVEAFNRRGTQDRLAVTASLLRADHSPVGGLILMIDYANTSGEATPDAQW